MSQRQRLALRRTLGDRTLNHLYGLNDMEDTIQKFGAMHGLTTAWTPLCQGGFYRTPTSDAALELLSSSIADTDGGLGAQTVVIEGISKSGSTFSRVSETVTLNGTTAVPLTRGFCRVTRMYVATSGTDANPNGVGSHAGTITLRQRTVLDTWAQIIVDGGVATGQSEIGWYTVPSGFIGCIEYVSILADFTDKAADVRLLVRENIGDTTTPYTSTMRSRRSFVGVRGEVVRYYDPPIGPFAGPCDIGFIAKMKTSTGNLSVDFDIRLVQESAE